jgi:hypothetical protein
VTDIHDLLGRAATEVPVSAHTVDADVLRGRRALGTRRARRVATPLAIATVGATAVTLGQLDTKPTPGPTHAVVHSPLPTQGAESPASAAPPVRLVAYTGQQPSGYRVAYVPAGWEIQGADPFAMTIAPIGFADQQPASFVGKLIVMLRSADDTGTPRGEARPVGHGTGYLIHTEGIVVLTYQDAAKHWLQLQVPPSLRWSDDDAAAFGAGVEVTKDAEPGRG